MNRDVAAVVVGSNLRVWSFNSAWRQLRLAGVGKVTGKRIDELFPGTDIRGSILDVLASGERLNGTVMKSGERYFSVTLEPIHEGDAKPHAVTMQVVELEGRIVVEGEAAGIVEMNEFAKRLLGGSAAGLLGKFSKPSVRTEENRRSHSLGRLRFQGEAGEVVIEGVLVPLDF